MEMVQRYVYPVDLTELGPKVTEICSKLGVSKAEAIRDAVEHYYEYVKGLKVIELREIPRAQAEKEILALVRKRGKIYTSEIADELRLDVILVDDILHELASGGKVKNK